MSNNEFRENQDEQRTLRFILLDSVLIADSILHGQQGQIKMLTRNDIVQFQNDEECQKYIEHKSNHRLVLITSGSCGLKLVPQIHHHPQVISIYVFCMDEIRHQKWACKFSKVIYF